MHTENEARKLWCPMARIQNGTHNPAAAYNRLIDFAEYTSALPAMSLCIASDCAMWRWTAKPVINQDGSRNETFPAEGCCGLAR